MKKFLTLILAVLMILSFVACNNALSGDTNSESNNTENNNGGESTDNGHTDSDDSNLNDEKPMCATHNYVNNICSVCNCSLWNGNIDTSWYSVVDTEFNISTAEQFAGFAQLVNNGTNFHDTTIELSVNIDLNNKEWVPIGTANTPFAGVLNGAEHTISNLIITSVSSSNLTESFGLLGYSEGKIENVNVDNLKIDITLDNNIYVGGVVGYNSGTINNCHANGAIAANTVSHGVFIGGVAGENEGDIKNCSNKSDVSCEGSSIYMGGVVGRSWEIVSIEQCSSSGDISGISSHNCYIGGIVGQIGNKKREKSVIKNCYSLGDISGSSEQKCFVGGLVGFLYNGSEIYNSYAFGNITGASLLKEHYVNFGGDSNNYAGGLVGYIDYAHFTRSLSVSNCWATSNIVLKTENGDGYAGFICGNYDEALFSNCYYSNEMLVETDHVVTFGTPANSNDFKNIAFYQNKMTAWDSKIWNLIDKTYPTLK